MGISAARLLIYSSLGNYDFYKILKICREVNMCSLANDFSSKYALTI
jgi:hypothetical protein